MKLWLVRHAQPLIASGVCYGATDVASDAQATQDEACALAKILPRGIAVSSSPLQRCEHLARCLQELRPDLRYKQDARLAEMDFGCWEDRRWDAIAQADFDGWMADFEGYRVGGAMTVGELMQRVTAAWDEMMADGMDAAWITHAGVIRAATLISRGQRRVLDATRWPRDAPPFGGWCELEI
jgi:alpha-ribazole phosphatase